MSLEIAAYRLYNQRLTQNNFNQAADVVRCLGAVQAQDFSGAKWAIGLRSKGLTDADVQRAFDDGALLRTHVLRPTWHFVAPEDIRWILGLTAPRVKARIAYYDRQLEIDKALLKKSNALLLKVLQGGNPLTRNELLPEFQKARIPAEGQRLGHLLMHAELDAIVCSGPRKGKQFTYVLLEERARPAKAMSRAESLAELVTRYVSTRGPATLQDFAWWSGLTVSDAREGMEMVKSQFTSETVEGQTYWLSGSVPPDQEASPTACLLPNYDEFFIGFKDRSAIGKFVEKAGIQKNDAALLANIIISRSRNILEKPENRGAGVGPHPCFRGSFGHWLAFRDVLIIINGQAAGGWKRALEKDKVRVEASLFVKLAPADQQALSDAAEQLGRFLGLPALFVVKEYWSEQRTSRSLWRRRAGHHSFRTLPGQVTK